MTMGGFVSFGFSFVSVESVFLGSGIDGMVSGCLGAGGTAWSGLVSFGAGLAGSVEVGMAGCLSMGETAWSGLVSFGAGLAGSCGVGMAGCLAVGALVSLGKIGLAGSWGL